MNEHSGGTVTDPLWAYVIAALFVFCLALVLFTVIDTVVRAVVRRWRAAGTRLDHTIQGGLAEIDLERWENEFGVGGGPR